VHSVSGATVPCEPCMGKPLILPLGRGCTQQQSPEGEVGFAGDGVDNDKIIAADIHCPHAPLASVLNDLSGFLQPLPTHLRGHCHCGAGSGGDRKGREDLRWNVMKRTEVCPK
jgi:hypothetical protein